MTICPFETRADLGASETPKAARQPVAIERCAYRVELYDGASFLELPPVKIRKLWALMFSDGWRNEQAVDTIRGWLPGTVADTKARRVELETALAVDQSDVCRQTAAAKRTAAKSKLKGTVELLREAKAEYIRAGKLQELFNTMAEKAGLRGAV